MSLVVVGLNHHTAPLEFREKLAFSKYPSEAYLAKLVEAQSVRSGLVVSTCNRVEIYAVGEEPEALISDTRRFLSSFHQLSDEELKSFLFSKTDREAIRHLFRVAASLDSMIVGEPQILGQVKEAYYASSSRALLDPFLDRLFRKAFSVSKKIRSETKIAEQAVSISYAAVELAKQIFGGLEDQCVMILGAGEMAELAAKHLKGAGVKEMFFANRSYEHAFDLAKDYGGISIPLDQFPSYLSRADVVIVSTAAPDYLVQLDQVEKALEERKQEPMFLIDISVPRNIDPSIDQFENVYLYNIDDLKNIVSQNLKNREDEEKKAEAIVEMEVEQFCKSTDQKEASPMIVALQDHFSSYRASELKRLRSRLAGLDETALSEIERSFDSLLKKVMSNPISFLKGDVSSLPVSERLELVRQILGIGKDDELK